jgi:two-component system LytT family response regulator
VLIADDEPTARLGMRRLVEGHPDFAIVAEARNGMEALDAINSSAPDVVFLDIEMPELTGIDAIRALHRDARPVVVFLTAYDEFAVQAFDIDAADYLMKPVTRERFAQAIERVSRRLKGGSADPSARLIVLAGKRSLILPLHEIDWIEAADYYCRVWMGGTSYLHRESLLRLERRVRRHGFARAHRRALVRTSCVRVLQTTPDGELYAVLASGTVIPVSRRRRRSFSDAVRARLRAGPGIEDASG